MSWVKRLFNDQDQQWKTLPKIILEKIYGKCDIFYPHFKSNTTQTSMLPKFYKNIITKWASCSTDPIDIGNVLGQRLWQNSFITISNKPVFIKKFCDANLCFVYQLFENGRVKSWNQIKDEFGLEQRLHFKYVQLIDSLPTSWKKQINENQLLVADASVQHCQGILHCTRLLPLERLTSKEIYTILIRNRNHVPTAQTTYKTKFINLSDENWGNFYLLPRSCMRDAYTRIFQYKILNNVLYLNKNYFFSENQQQRSVVFAAMRKLFIIFLVNVLYQKNYGGC